MAKNLNQLSDDISSEFTKQSRRFFKASLFVKVVLISAFSTIAAVAQFAQFPASGPEAWQIVGICASLIVAIGGVFVVLTEQDSTEQLAIARNALDAAKDAESKYEIIGDLIADSERLIELFQSITVMRGAIEHLTVIRDVDEDDIVSKLLKASERSLAIAADFAQYDQWTICIYKAFPCSIEQNRAVLKCIAHKRAIHCETNEAREWKEGTGIMGVAYSNADEMIVPDLQADGMRAVFGSAANETRPYDAERYRSMVAVPVKVEGMAKPWGVVTATNDRVDHFTPTAAEGVRPDEAIRALAGMVALAVAVIRNR